MGQNSDQYLHIAGSSIDRRSGLLHNQAHAIICSRRNTQLEFLLLTSSIGNGDRDLFAGKRFLQGQADLNGNLGTSKLREDIVEWRRKRRAAKIEMHIVPLWRGLKTERL